MVDALIGEQHYAKALNAIWNNLVSTRIYITGGLGAQASIEGFGPAYEQPNKIAYSETCAAVGNVFFNQGMFLGSGDARYLDIAEISLFNNALAGISLTDDRFFMSIRWRSIRSVIRAARPGSDAPAVRPTSRA